MSRTGNKNGPSHSFLQHPVDHHPSWSRRWRLRRQIWGGEVEPRGEGEAGASEPTAHLRSLSASRGCGVCPRAVQLRAPCRCWRPPRPDQSATADSHTTSFGKSTGAPASRRALLSLHHRPSSPSPRSQHLTGRSASSKRAVLCAFTQVRPRTETAVKSSCFYVATSSTKNVSHHHKSAPTGGERRIKLGPFR